MLNRPIWASCCRWPIVVACLLVTSGCYYTQAALGQLEVLRKRQPIADVIGNPETPEELGARLRLVQEARAFSIRELGLPDNDSYRSYADLERDYVVWNVFAAPEFSLQPKQWCYPVAGCVSYRGYFKRSAATKLARKLEDKGYDVLVGGVSAYSTLGRFDDPVLNTMLRWDDTQLVAVLFHELAHQVLYVKGDTAFNESFATAVEEFGMERFLAQSGREGSFEEYVAGKNLRRELMLLVDAARADLQTYYSESIDPDEKRLLKEHRIERLAEDLRIKLQDAGRDPNGWLGLPLNNARIASLVMYEGRLPAFRHMLGNCDADLECFYAEARRLAELDKDARDAILDAL